MQNNWFVYMLVNTKGRTYIGSTTDPLRRLREHNGEIKGGAKATRNHGPWRLYCYISGFKTRSEACRWEKIIKSRARGLTERKQAFVKVCVGMCPSYKNRKYYPIPENLTIVWLNTGTWYSEDTGNWIVSNVDRVNKTITLIATLKKRIEENNALISEARIVIPEKPKEKQK